RKAGHEHGRCLLTQAGRVVKGVSFAHWGPSRRHRRPPLQARSADIVMSSSSFAASQQAPIIADKLPRSALLSSQRRLYDLEIIRMPTSLGSKKGSVPLSRRHLLKTAGAAGAALSFGSLAAPMIWAQQPAA